MNARHHEEEEIRSEDLKINGDAISTKPVSEKNTGTESLGGEALGPEQDAEDPENEATSYSRDTTEGCGYPEIPEPSDPARILSHNNLRKQRILFWTIIACLNVGMTMIAVFGKTGIVVVVLIVLIKSKVFFSSRARTSCRALCRLLGCWSHTSIDYLNH